MNLNKENEDIKIDEINQKIKEYFGFVPKIFQVLSKNPAALKTYFDKMEVMILDQSLSTSTKELVFIGAAAATGSSHCLRTHLEVARKLDLSPEQTLLAIIIGASVAETTALSQSLRVYEDLKD